MSIHDFHTKERIETLSRFSRQAGYTASQHTDSGEREAQDSLWAVSNTRGNNGA